MNPFQALVSISLAAGLLQASPGAAGVPTLPVNSVRLFGFERPEEIACWSRRKLTDLRQTHRWAASGKAAAAITYHKWSPGKEKWPAVIASASRHALKITDFSLFDALVFQAYDPQDFPVVIKLHLRDAAGRRFSRTFPLQPKTAAECSVPIQELKNAVDVAHVAQIHLFTTQPERTYTVYVDDLRLTLNLRPAVRKLLYRALALQTRAETRLAHSPGTAPALARAWLEEIDQVRAAAKKALLRLDHGGLPSWSAAAVLKRQVHDWTAALDRCQAILPLLRARTLAAETGADGFVIALESPMRKVFLELGRFSSPFGTHYSLEAARNEYESFQVIVVPFEKALSRVRCRVLSPLTGPNGARIPLSVRLVGYVNCRRPSYTVPHTGWWPDPLLDMVPEVARAPLGEVLTFWVTAHVPENAPPGNYAGALLVSAAGRRPQSVAVTLTVWNFTLPKKTHLRTALSFRGLSQIYPRDQVKAMTRKYENWMLRDYHLNPGDIYGGPPAWDEARLRELKKLGLNAINLAYINAPRGNAFQPDRFWRKFQAQCRKIAQWLPRAQRAGVRDLCYVYCFDERPADQLDILYQAANRLKKEWPDIEVMTTAYDHTFGLERKDGKAVDIWVPLTPRFDSEATTIARARRAGRDVWWYICIGPKHPWANWFIEYPAIEARLLMGAMTAKYRPGGFLYYAVNRWPKNRRPIVTGPRTDWNPASYKINNGDGSIMCAGPNGPLATIRLENIRDGIEDFEYYCLLRTLAARYRENPGILTRIGRLLGFSSNPASPRTLQVSPTVVRDLTHYTHSPETLLAERRRIARAILRLQEIETRPHAP